MSYYADHWRINHYSDIPLALHLGGSRFKAYCYRPNVIVAAEEDNGTRVNYLYAMNTNKDETTFELLYQISKGNAYSPNVWHPVPPEILERLFKTKDGKWNFCDMYSSDDDWANHTKIEIVDGHFLFRYPTRWLRSKIASISVDSIHFSVLGRMVYEMDNNIAVALAFYPEHKYTMEDTSRIIEALRIISNVSYYLVDTDDGMSWRKKRMFERLEKAKSDLAEYEKKYQEILDKAADAMNLMSEKYGIEVDI